MPEDHVRHAPLIDQQTPPRPRAVRPRHAASLIVYRGDGDDVSMLMGMRGAKHRFMPNRLVFPGGAVDRADLDAPSATPLSPQTEHLLRKNANARLAHGLGIAAARELHEETGLSLGPPPRLRRAVSARARRHAATRSDPLQRSVLRGGRDATSLAHSAATANWKSCVIMRCRKRWRSISPCRRGVCWSGCGYGWRWSGPSASPRPTLPSCCMTAVGEWSSYSLLKRPATAPRRAGPCPPPPASTDAPARCALLRGAAVDALVNTVYSSVRTCRLGPCVSFRWIACSRIMRCVSISRTRLRGSAVADRGPARNTSSVRSSSSRRLAK